MEPKYKIEYLTGTMKLEPVKYFVIGGPVRKKWLWLFPYWSEEWFIESEFGIRMGPFDDCNKAMLIKHRIENASIPYAYEIKDGGIKIYRIEYENTSMDR